MKSDEQIKENFFQYACNILESYPAEKEGFIQIWSNGDIPIAHAYFLKFVHDKLSVSLLEKKEYREFFTAFIY